MKLRLLSALAGLLAVLPAVRAQTVSTGPILILSGVSAPGAKPGQTVTVTVTVTNTAIPPASTSGASTGASPEDFNPTGGGQPVDFVLSLVGKSFATPTINLGVYTLSLPPISAGSSASVQIPGVLIPTCYVQGTTYSLTASMYPSPAQAATAVATMSGSVSAVQLTPNAPDLTGHVTGLGYTSPPAVSFTDSLGDAGSGAAALAFEQALGSYGSNTAPVNAGGVLGVSLTSAGSGYSQPPTVAFGASPLGAFDDAQAQASITGGISGINVLSAGTGYSSVPVVVFSSEGPGSGASAGVTVFSGSSLAATVTNPGSGYTTTSPAVTVAGGGGTGATAVATTTSSTGLGSVLLIADTTNGTATSTGTTGGSGYTSPPIVTISGGGGTGATATAVTNAFGVVTGITVASPGSGYTSTPSVFIGAPVGVTATVSDVDVQVSSLNGSVIGIAATTGGSGYTAVPVVTIDPPTPGITATATAVLGTGPAAGTVVELTGSAGSGYYTSTPTVTIAPPPAGTPATATANLNGTILDSLSLTNAGTGYTSAPLVTISGGGGTGAQVTASVAGGVITGFTVNNAGSGYTTAPTVAIALPPALPASDTATAVAVMSSGVQVEPEGGVLSYTITNAGADYPSPPSVTVSAAPGGSQALAVAVLSPFNNGVITGINITSPGSGYTTVPTVTIAGPVGIQAQAVANLLQYNSVTGITFTSIGTGYTSAPTLTIAPPDTQATATVQVSGGALSLLAVGTGGSGYTSAPTVTISGPPAGGTQAAATATINANGLVTGFTITNAGAGYASAPTVTLSAPPAGVQATASLDLTLSAGVSTGTTSVSVTNPGAGYTLPASPSYIPAPPTLASAGLSSVVLTNVGSGYSPSTLPTVTITGGGGSGAAAVASVLDGSVTAITVTRTGSGYTSTPTVTITGGGGSGAAAAAVRQTAPVQVQFAGGGPNLNNEGNTLFNLSQNTAESDFAVSGNHDLQITDLHYAAGLSYQGGDVIPMSLTYRNNPFTNGAANVPFAPSGTGANSFRIEVNLSTNAAFGDSDDFELMFNDIVGTLNADGQEHTLTWYQQIPGNFAGTYSLIAMIDSLNATGDITVPTSFMNGNNTWYDEYPGIQTPAPLLTIQNSNFPTTTLVSATTGGVSSNNYSDHPSITQDGRYTAFASDSTNLGSTQATDGSRNVYVYDNQTQLTRLVSLSAQGQQGNGGSDFPALNLGTTGTSAVTEGEFVAFQTDASNLIQQVSASGGQLTAFTGTSGGSGYTTVPTVTLSAPGVGGTQAAAFATLLGGSVQSVNILTPGSGYSSPPTVTIAAPPSGGITASATAVISAITPAVPADTNGFTDIYRVDTGSGSSGISAITRVSVGGSNVTGQVQANGASYNPSISADGRYVVFESTATNLVSSPAVSSAFHTHIYVHDCTTGVTSLVDQNGGAVANGSSTQPVISADGSTIAFTTAGTNLGAPGSDAVGSFTNVYVVGRSSLGSPTLVTAVSGPTGANGSSFSPSLSADGSYVAYSSGASNLVPGDTNGVNDIFVYHNTATPATVRVSCAAGVDNAAAAIQATATATLGTGPASGTVAAISGGNLGAASNGPYASIPNVTLAGGGGVGATATAVLSNGSYGSVTGITVVNPGVGYTGAPTVTIDSPITQGIDSSEDTFQLGSFNPSISGDGRFVTFASLDSNLTQGTFAAGIWSPTLLIDTINVFRVDRDVNGTGEGAAVAAVPASDLDQVGNTAISDVSVNPFGYDPEFLLGVPSTAASDISPVISGDGRWVAFPCDAENNGGLAFGHTNLLPLDSNGFRDVFLYDSRLNVLSSSASPAPSVSISNYSDIQGSPFPQVQVNTTVKIEANAAATVTVQGLPISITQVQFFVDGTSIGVATGGNFGENWTPTTPGTYTLTADAVDADGNVGVSPPVFVTVFTENTSPPTVALTTIPPSTLAVNTSVTLSATANITSTLGSIASVEFLANGVPLGTVTAAPYSFTWTPTAIGNYAITVVATDSSGNQATSTQTAVVQVLAPAPTPASGPTVLITSPANASTSQVNVQTLITANALPQNLPGNIASVQFFANGVSLGTVTQYPYQIQWTPTSLGTYSLTALAVDNSGNQTTSTAVSVTVQASGVPAAVISTPGTAILNTNLPLAVQVGASTPVGTIGSVTLLANGVPVATQAASAALNTYTGGAWASPSPIIAQLTIAGQPAYAAVWSFPFAPTSPGTYVLTLEATTDQGAITISAPVTVTVNSVHGPTVSISSPVSGSSYLAGSSVSLSSLATAATGSTITGVEYLVNGVALSQGFVANAPYGAAWTPNSTGIYSINAVAEDSTGLEMISTPVLVTVTAPSAPTVSVSNIIPGTSVSVGTSLQITATAATATGSISVVQFFADGSLIGTASAPPYAIAWTPSAAGIYTITAEATNTSGATATSTGASVQVSASAAPTVSFLTPAGGATLPVNTGVLLTATAAPAGGSGATIASVQYYANGTAIGTVSTASPSYPVTWTPAAPGSYMLQAIATDTLGKQSNVGVAGTFETVTITSGTAPTVTVAVSGPASGFSFTTGEAIPLTATANPGSTGVIQSVEFLENGTVIGSTAAFPYSLTWKPQTPGTYALTAIVTDSIGNEVPSSPITVSVGAANLPSVTLLSPGTATYQLGSSVTLVADPALPSTPLASTASIASVQFFANGAPVLPATGANPVTAAPYSLVWTPAAAGLYSLTAVVTDSLGNAVSSNAVSINVNSGSAPTANITSPSATSAITGATIPLSVQASSTNGAVSAVQFLINGVNFGTPMTAPPYTTIWTPTIPGSYSISALVTDAAGLSALVSNPVTVNVNYAGGAPTVAVSNPGVAGATVALGSGLELTAAASPSAAGSIIASVEFLANGVPLPNGTVTTPPYAMNWMPSGAGTYTITALATDNLGDVAVSGGTTVTVTSALAPVVSITNPLPGSSYVVGAIVPVTASATTNPADPTDTVLSVAFFRNGLPITASWNPQGEGTFTLTAVASNRAGRSTVSAPVTVTVVASPSPVVVLASPSTATAGIPVQLSATAGDPDGVVTAVQFDVNGVEVADATTAPYAGTWIPTVAGTYSVTAVATDTFGNVTVSAATSVAVAPGGLPTVTLTPVSNSTVTVFSNQSLVATATPYSGGSIQSVQFFVKGASIGTLTTPPYVEPWVPASVGPVVITAVATDNLGNQSTATSTVTVIAGTPPTVSLTSPVSGSTIEVNQPVSLAATAASSVGTIQSVQFLANGAVIGTATSFPYTVSWTPSSPGPVVLEVMATDSAGNGSTAVSTVTVTNGTRPNLSFISPVEPALPPVTVTVNTPVTVSASASIGSSTMNASIVSVQFLANGLTLGTVITPNPNYTVQWTPFAAGTYVLTAIATDSLGNTTTQSEPVSVVIGAAPSASITSPAGTPIAVLMLGHAVPVQTSVTAGTGTIASVQILANGVAVGKAVAFPYTVDWTPAAPGSYALTAVVTDSLGNQGTSAAVAVDIVTGSAPTVSLSSSAASIPIGTGAELVATPVLPSGSTATIASVQFLANGVLIPGGMVTAPPYNLNWKPSASGAYILTALVTDSLGNTGTSTPLTVAVVPSPSGAPTVSVTSPLNNPAGVNAYATGSPVSIEVNATSTLPITQVQVLVNGLPQGAPITTAPYVLAWTPASAGTYSISALATDSSGASTWSTAVVVSVTTGAAPSVAITSPGSGSTVSLGSGLVVSASATSPSSTIKSVQFFANGTALPNGTVTAAPYSVGWVPTTAGSNTLTAVATDALGNVVTSSGITVTVTSVAAPTVSITSPVNGTEYVAGAFPIPITASATTPSGTTLTQVEFLANGIPIGSATLPPYALSWKPTAAGTYNLTALATNSALLTSVSSVTTITVAGAPPPTVALVSPVTETVPSGSPILLSVQATDLLGTVTAVQYEVTVNGVTTVVASSSSAPSYLVTSWAPTAPGTYTVTALATDSFGAIGVSTPVSLVVSAGSPPTVTLSSSPSSSTIQLGTGVQLTAIASSTSPIASVQFFANGTSIGTVSTPPYTVGWIPNSVGPYALNAVATDTLGHVATSAALSVTVTSSPAPTVAILSPFNGGATVVGSSLLYEASASTVVGNVSEVQLLVNGSVLATKTSPPYSTAWNPTAAGTYVLQAIAYNTGGLFTASSEVVITVDPSPPPVISLTSPSFSGSYSVGDPITLTASAGDEFGTITTVEFFFDTVGTQGNVTGLGPPVPNGILSTAPYQTTWTPTLPGTYAMDAQATDSFGTVVPSVPVVFTVNAHVPPVVSITSPSSGLVLVAGSSTTLTASASSSSGTISSVQFVANGVNIGSPISAPPYTVGWTPLSTGIYTLTAIATDNAHAQTTSAGVTVNVIAASSAGVTSVYTGTCFNSVGAPGTGGFALVTVDGTAAAFIAQVGTASFTASGVALNSVSGSSTFQLPGTSLSSVANATFASGNFTLPSLGAYIFDGTMPSGSSLAGYYTGSLAGQAGSQVLAIVGPDGSLAVSIQSGAYSDVAVGGPASVSSLTGAYSLTTAAGHGIRGTINPSTDFLSGTLTGGPGGTLLASLSSGGLFSDGVLRNLSARGSVPTGGSVSASFTLSQRKQLLIRGAGPTLGLSSLSGGFGVAGSLTTPVVTLLDSNNLTIASNTGWLNGLGAGISPVASLSTLTMASNGVQSGVGAFSFQTAADSALVATLPQGSYSVKLSGGSGSSGVGLIEVYDLDNLLSPLATDTVPSLSTTGTAGNGQLLIGGLVIDGTQPKRVLIQAVGPGLGSSGLGVPTLRLFNSAGVEVRENTGWSTSNDTGLVGAAQTALGISALTSTGDSAILVTLEPGIYTAQVSGPAGVSGTVNLQTYEVP